MNSIHELRAMTANLQDYVIDGDLYKTITVKGDHGESLIKMTVGGMLERIAELTESGAATDVVTSAQEALAREQRSQPDNFWALVAREAKSYADSWQWYLQRLEEGDEQSLRDFKSEAGTRTRLERLLNLDEEQPTLNEARRRTAALDERLKAMWIDSGTGSGTDFWWLHGMPKAPAER